MRARRSLVILLGAAGLVRCSLLFGTNQLTATGNQSSADGSAEGDAHPDAASSDGDAGKDSPGDSKPGDSGNLEAGDSEAEAGTFCESLVPQPTFCSDFDTVDFPAGWDTLSGWGKCKATLDTTLYASPPRSFRATSPQLTTGDCSSVLKRKFTAPKSSLAIDFDLMIVAQDTNSTLDLVNISMSASGGTDNTVLRLTPWAAEINESVNLTDGGTLYGGHALPEIPSLGTWYHIHWSIDLTGTNATSNVTMDGLTTGHSLHMKDFLADPEISIGLGYVAAPADPCDFVFDNVVVDIK